ncbi:hypothetical protein [Bdellovibrio sp. GT3]|uniref:hypothetical protein n=1 Tax=Bdellovibrio sp. GT3 TaxID=3136282 RepID=UPI0030F3440A
MSKAVSLLALFTNLLISVAAFGGPWISSGGDLVGDTRNPWFVINSPVVKYCIKIDATTFSASSASVKAALEKSLGFWRNEFQENENYAKGSLNHLPLSIPQFLETPCDAQVDLKLVLGEGALSPQEALYVRSRGTEVVALTVRTDYNLVTLKGRGFLYIAGDLNKPEWLEQVWKNESRLTTVIAHEVGHILGIPHLGGDFATMTGIPESPAALNLMAESLPQAAVLKNKIGYGFVQGIAPILSNLKRHESCEISASTRHWLKISETVHCLRVELSPLNTEQDIVASLYAVEADGSTHLLGHFTVDMLSRTLLNYKFDVITQLVLNKEQKVFAFAPSNSVDFLAGGVQLFASMNLKLTSIDPAAPARSVILTVSPLQMVILGGTEYGFTTLFSSNRIRPLF